MADNPGLAPAVKKRYEALYSGAFYERFVLGRWSAPQGLVYPMFRPEQHVVQVLPAVQGPYYISCDYGTVNPMSMGLWGQHGGVWYRMREFYHDARLCGVLRTDEEYYAALEELAGELPIRAVIVDPSAASFLQCVRSHGRFCCMPARNDVAAGVRRVADLLQTGKLRFDQSCRDTLREFSLYCWDPERDAPKKEHDHAMDDLRYFVMTALERPRSGFYAPTLERGVI